MTKRLDRRALLGMAAIAPVAAACNGFTQVVSNLPTYATDVQNIATDLTALTNTIGMIQGIPAATVAKVQGAISKLSGLAAQISAAATAVAGQTPTALLGQFGNTVLGIIQSIGGSGATGTLGTVLQAISAVLPSILSVAGIALAGPVTSTMTETQGRAYLATLASSLR